MEETHPDEQNKTKSYDLCQDSGGRVQPQRRLNLSNTQQALGRKPLLKTHLPEGTARVPSTLSGSAAVLPSLL